MRVFNTSGDAPTDNDRELSPVRCTAAQRGKEEFCAPRGWALRMVHQCSLDESYDEELVLWSVHSTPEYTLFVQRTDRARSSPLTGNQVVMQARLRTRRNAHPRERRTAHGSVSLSPRSRGAWGWLAGGTGHGGLCSVRCGGCLLPQRGALLPVEQREEFPC